MDSPLLKSPTWLVPVIIGTTVIIFFTDVFVPIGVVMPMLFVIPVYLAGWLPQRWALPLAGVVAGILTVLGAFLSPPGGVFWIVWTNRVLAVITIWLTIAVGLGQRRLAAEIKNLHGMLPICASCKKIRDEQGRWHTLELFIRDHSEAQFTHGLCPICLESYTTELQQRGAAKH
jgi:hypothetical protein